MFCLFLRVGNFSEKDAVNSTVKYQSLYREILVQLNVYSMTFVLISGFFSDFIEGKMFLVYFAFLRTAGF